MGEKKKKIIKTIKVDVDLCNGCRACEVICSAFHATPKYSSNNPARSRIRVIHEYDECAFCRASCPSRDLFKEPDSGLPLKCDMCEGEEEPWCVKWCITDALTYEEREEEVEEEESPEEMEIGLEALANKYGLDKIMDTVARMSMKGENIAAKGNSSSQEKHLTGLQDKHDSNPVDQEHIS